MRTSLTLETAYGAVEDHWRYRRVNAALEGGRPSAVHHYDHQRCRAFDPACAWSAFGCVSKEDADQMMAVIGRGRDMSGCNAHPERAAANRFAERRGAFSERAVDSRTRQAWCGVVCDQPLTPGGNYNFILSVTGKNRKVKRLPSEADEATWLDERVPPPRGAIEARVT